MLGLLAPDIAYQYHRTACKLPASTLPEQSHRCEQPLDSEAMLRPLGEGNHGADPVAMPGFERRFKFTGAALRVSELDGLVAE